MRNKCHQYNTETLLMEGNVQKSEALLNSAFIHSVLISINKYVSDVLRET